ncbi:hypothetical protein ACXVUM_08520 [Williamsia sp. SKLECPSW1]
MPDDQHRGGVRSIPAVNVYSLVTQVVAGAMLLAIDARPRFGETLPSG